MLYDECFKEFSSVKECRIYYSGQMLNALKKYFGLLSDFALSKRLGISQVNLSHVRSGDRPMPFCYLKDLDIEPCARLLIENCYTMSVICPLYFNKS